MIGDYFSDIGNTHKKFWSQASRDQPAYWKKTLYSDPGRRVADWYQKERDKGQAAPAQLAMLGAGAVVASPFAMAGMNKYRKVKGNKEFMNILQSGRHGGQALSNQGAAAFNDMWQKGLSPSEVAATRGQGALAEVNSAQAQYNKIQPLGRTQDFYLKADPATQGRISSVLGDTVNPTKDMNSVAKNYFKSTPEQTAGIRKAILEGGTVGSVDFSKMTPELRQAYLKRIDLGSTEYKALSGVRKQLSSRSGMKMGELQNLYRERNFLDPNQMRNAGRAGYHWATPGASAAPAIGDAIKAVPPPISPSAKGALRRSAKTSRGTRFSRSLGSRLSRVNSNPAMNYASNPGALRSVGRQISRARGGGFPQALKRGITKIVPKMGPKISRVSRLKRLAGLMSRLRRLR